MSGWQTRDPSHVGLDPADYTSLLPYPKLNASGTGFEPDEGAAGGGGGSYTVVNVRDYGATGDGTTNDTAAIHAAIAALPASGGIVYFPPGVYICAVRVEKANVRITGSHAAVLKTQNSATADNTDCPLRILADDVTVENLRIDGNIANQTFSQSSSSRADGIAIYADRVTVRNCIVEDTAGHGIIIWNRSFGSASVGARYDCRIIGNTIRRCRFRAAIDIASTSGTLANDVSERHVIAFNHIEGGAASPGNTAGITMHSARDVVIVGNTIRDVLRGMPIHSSSERILIADNVIDDCGQTGVWLFNFDRDFGARDVTIKGNTVRDTPHGVEVEDGQRVVIAHNLIGNTTAAAIKIDAGSAFRIDGNLFNAVASQYLIDPVVTDVRIDNYLSDDLPEPVGDAADAGSSLQAARGDHVHVGGSQAKTLVVLSDFGSGPEPVTDGDGLWLYGRYDIELEH